MAIDKQPPFPNENKSDKGFKDSILICSLFDFAKKTNFDRYILVSTDKGFTNNIDELKIDFLIIVERSKIILKSYLEMSLIVGLMKNLVCLRIYENILMILSLK